MALVNVWMTCSCNAIIPCNEQRIFHFLFCYFVRASSSPIEIDIGLINLDFYCFGRVSITKYNLLGL